MRIGNTDILEYRKDGGPESYVWGFFVLAIKQLFSVVLLRFEDGSRDAYHSHAFNCFSWVIKGELLEEDISYMGIAVYKPSWLPFVTRRETFHKVTSVGTTYVLSIRGPWAPTWREWVPDSGEHTLTWGRKVVE